MTTNTWLLLGAGGLAAAAVIYWRRSSPAVHREKMRPPKEGVAVSGSAVQGVTFAGGSVLDSFAGLPDPSNLPLGTKSADGRWVVSQTRQVGSVPHWEEVFSGFGGGVPGMIT